MTSQPGPIDATAKPVPLMPRSRVLLSPSLFRALLILDHRREVVGAEPRRFEAARRPRAAAEKGKARPRRIPSCAVVDTATNSDTPGRA